MQIKDWKVVGQVISIFTDLFIVCRQCMREINVSPEILEWMIKTMDGRQAIQIGIATLVAKWKISCELACRTNEIKIDPNVIFEELVKMCNFEGQNATVNSSIYPSKNIDRTSKVCVSFEEIAFGYAVPIGKESVCMERDGLRPAEPIEYLHWLAKNSIAGIATTINCAIYGYNGHYMSVGVCGRGGRGLHIVKPKDDRWPPATVFLGVKLNKN